MRSNKDNFSLEQAYLSTIYRILVLPPIDLKINHYNGDLHRFCLQNKINSWAFLSAFNPQSQLLSQDENNHRHKRLLHFIKKEGYSFEKALGIPTNKDWVAEKNLFLPNISLKKTHSIAKQFDQKAFLFSTTPSPKLYYTKN